MTYHKFSNFRLDHIFYEKYTENAPHNQMQLWQIKRGAEDCNLILVTF